MEKLTFETHWMRSGEVTPNHPDGLTLTCPFLFDDGYDDRLLKEHYARIQVEMKEALKSGCGLGRLLDGIPPRPDQHGRPLATGLTVTHNPRYEMGGLFTKYQFEYRRPYPVDAIMPLDVWSREKRTEMDADVVAKLEASHFDIDPSVLPLVVRGRDDIDWDAMGAESSSMLVPLTSAGGDVMVRKVMTMNIPGLCWVLR